MQPPSGPPREAAGGPVLPIRDDAPYSPPCMGSRPLPVMPAAALPRRGHRPHFTEGELKTHTHTHTLQNLQKQRKLCPERPRRRQPARPLSDGRSHCVCTPRTARRAVLKRILAVISLPW